MRYENGPDFSAELMMVAMRAQMTMMVSNLKTENEREKKHNEV